MFIFNFNKKACLKSVLAIVLAFILVNGLTFFYSWDRKYVKKEDGVTNGLYCPGDIIINNKEGYGYSIVDDNGYLNETSCLSENYVLVLGNSQSNGTNVKPQEKYVSLLNRKISDKEEATFYNMSTGGYTFVEIAQGFNAAVTEYPNSMGVVVQILTTDIAPEKLDEALHQRTSCNKENEYEYHSYNRSLTEKLVAYIKETCPLLIEMIQKFQRAKISNASPFVAYNKKESYTYNKNCDSEYIEEYEESLNKIFDLMRLEYDGRIAVIYMPSISIVGENGLVINREETTEIFSRSCANHNIDFIDMTEDYLKAFEKNVIPYGFSNSRLGEGHLNAEGHKLVADRLLEWYYHS